MKQSETVTKLLQYVLIPVGFSQQFGKSGTVLTLYWGSQ